MIVQQEGFYEWACFQKGLLVTKLSSTFEHVLYGDHSVDNQSAIGRYIGRLSVDSHFAVRRYILVNRLSTVGWYTLVDCWPIYICQLSADGQSRVGRYQGQLSINSLSAVGRYIGRLSVDSRVTIGRYISVNCRWWSCDIRPIHRSTISRISNPYLLNFSSK